MLKERIRRLRTASGISQTVLGKHLNVSQQAIAKWEKGLAEPDTENIARISELFNVTTDYLLGKSDSMLSLDRLVAIDALEPEERIPIPLYGTVKAGYGDIVIEEFMGMEFFDKSSFQSGQIEDYFCLKVKGDSMSPKLENGDIVLVKKQRDAENGKIIVAAINGEDATIKKLKKGRDYIELIPCNPAYESQVIEQEQLEDFYIIGLVVEMKRKF